MTERPLEDYQIKLIARARAGEKFPGVCPSCYSTNVTMTGQPLGGPRWRPGPDMTSSKCEKCGHKWTIVHREEGRSELDTAFEKAVEAASNSSKKGDKALYILSYNQPVQHGHRVVAGTQWYVSHRPGDGGVDWGYTKDPSQAQPLSEHWKRRFMKLHGHRAVTATRV